MPDIFLTPPAVARPPTLIRIAPGAIATLNDGSIPLDTFDDVVMLFDEGVQAIAATIHESIPQARSISVPSGDASKSLTMVQSIADTLVARGCGRRTLIVTVGGGMVSDLGGFVASIFARGIPCVHVPTSVLAMVDAAIGGKTAVNLTAAKNMLGTIHHPIAVFIDTDIAAAVPEKSLAEGMAEIVKIACVHDSEFVAWFEAHCSALLSRDRDTLTTAITRAVSLKVAVVEEDEHDALARLSLNFGHTVGHAIESLSQYLLSHGACVAIGMIAEMTLVSHPGTERLRTLLSAFSLPTDIPHTMHPHDLWTRMKSDKKNVRREVNISVPMALLGSWALRTVAESEFLRLFEHA